MSEPKIGIRNLGEQPDFDGCTSPGYEGWGFSLTMDSVIWTRHDDPRRLYDTEEAAIEALLQVFDNEILSVTQDMRAARRALSRLRAGKAKLKASGKSGVGPGIVHFEERQKAEETTRLLRAKAKLQMELRKVNKELS